MLPIDNTNKEMINPFDSIAEETKELEFTGQKIRDAVATIAEANGKSAEKVAEILSDGELSMNEMRDLYDTNGDGAYSMSEKLSLTNPTEGASMKFSDATSILSKYRLAPSNIPTNDPSDFAIEGCFTGHIQTINIETGLPVGHATKSSEADELNKIVNDAFKKD